MFAGELLIGLSGLLQRAFLGVGDDELQQRIVAPQPRKVHLRETNRRDLLLPQGDAEFAHGRECPRFVGNIAAALRSGDDLRDVWRRAQP